MKKRKEKGRGGEEGGGKEEGKEFGKGRELRADMPKVITACTPAGFSPCALVCMTSSPTLAFMHEQAHTHTCATSYTAAQNTAERLWGMHFYSPTSSKCPPGSPWP